MLEVWNALGPRVVDGYPDHTCSAKVKTYSENAKLHYN